MDRRERVFQYSSYKWNIIDFGFFLPQSHNGLIDLNGGFLILVKRGSSKKTFSFLAPSLLSQCCCLDVCVCQHGHVSLYMAKKTKRVTNDGTLLKCFLRTFASSSGHSWGDGEEPYEKKSRLLYSWHQFFLVVVIVVVFFSSPPRSGSLSLWWACLIGWYKN